MYNQTDSVNVTTVIEIYIYIVNNGPRYEFIDSILESYLNVSFLGVITPSVAMSGGISWSTILIIGNWSVNTML